MVVSIHNAGAQSINDVRVYVTGREYLLGQIGNGETKKCRVQPKGESEIELRFKKTNGSEVHHVIDCYLESNYRGSVDVDLDDGDTIQADIKI